MFIETLKSIVITLVTVLIFISAVELISPNKMKKYIKFVLGLILIATILNPIIQFISGGEKSVLESIKNLEEVFSKKKENTDSETINTLKNNYTEDSRKKTFVNNFNKNCDTLLKNKFKNMNFKSEVDCDVDFNNVTLNVKKLRIGVIDNKIDKIKKVVIDNKVTREESKEFSEVIDFIKQELNIPKDKIEVYELEE